MRLSEVLNYVPDTSTRQVENFLGSRVLRPGTHRNVRVGTAIRNRHCQECSDTRTFASKSELSCLVTGEKALSIDTVMTCTVGKGRRKSTRLHSSHGAASHDGYALKKQKE